MLIENNKIDNPCNRSSFLIQLDIIFGKSSDTALSTALRKGGLKKRKNKKQKTQKKDKKQTKKYRKTRK